jgi:DNA-binding transcriptional LysR family regulator
MTVDVGEKLSDNCPVIDWLLANHPHFIRFSRWIVVACAAALLGIARLPHSAVDRVIAIVGILLVGLVFALWLAVVLVTIIRPRTLADIRQSRANGASLRNRKSGRDLH